MGQFAPEPTPSMSDVVVDVEVIEEDVKPLSPVQKSKVNDLVEAGQAANEIAEALNLDVNRIIQYLNK